MAMSMGRKGEEDDEDELERIAEEHEERRERNRLWREERERRRRRERGEVSSEDEEESDVGGSSKGGGRQLSEMKSMFVCTACQEDLGGGGKIWQCQVGHPVCRQCVDVSWLAGDEDEESFTSCSTARKQSLGSLDRFSAISDNSVKQLIENMTEAELLDLLDRSSDTASTVTFSGPTLSERQIQEIDWFLNTLDIKKDAIKPYADYHDPEDMARAQREAEEEERRLAELESSDDETVGEDDKWETIPKDELEMLHSEAMKAKLKAENASDDSGNDTLSESTLGGRFSAPKPVIKPLDWFADTIEIKKDVIQPYSDYNAEEEGQRTVRISDDVRVLGDEEDGLDSASVLGRMNRRSKICKSCEAPVIGRNMFLENLVKVIHH